jgi:hypothetical protein
MMRLEFDCLNLLNCLSKVEENCDGKPTSKMEGKCVRALGRNTLPAASIDDLSGMV